ncbi:MAG: hypothetical protein K5910_03755, partial [Bacteroidales bacterium]|nr:hypothetical protein [Bacteroidales bacterium]
MFSTFILFLPPAACLFWILIHSMMGRRTDSFRPFLALLAVSGVFLYTDSCYSNPSTSSRALVIGSLLALFTATGILPCLRLYLEKLRNEKGTRAARMLWAVISVVLSATALI